METVPQCRDCPAPARRSHAPARADPNAGPGCPRRANHLRRNGRLAFPPAYAPSPFAARLDVGIPCRLFQPPETKRCPLPKSPPLMPPDAV